MLKFFSYALEKIPLKVWNGKWVFRNDLHTKWNVLSICIPVLFIGYSEFYWFISKLLSGVSGWWRVNIDIEFCPRSSLSWCQLFAMSLPDICHWHTWPRRSLPGLATVSQAWPMAMSLPDFYMSTESQQSQFRHQTCNISSSANFIVTFSLQKLSIRISFCERSVNE